MFLQVLDPMPNSELTLKKHVLNIPVYLGSLLPVLWTVDQALQGHHTWWVWVQVHTVDVKSRLYHLQPQQKSGFIMFFSLTAQCWWVCVTAVSRSCRWLTAEEPDMVSAVLEPSSSRFNMLFILRCFSVHHSCKEQLSEFLEPFCQLQPVWFLLWSLTNKVFPSPEQLLTGCFCFSHHSG